MPFYFSNPKLLFVCLLSFYYCFVYLSFNFRAISINCYRWPRVSVKANSEVGPHQSNRNLKLTYEDDKKLCQMIKTWGGGTALVSLFSHFLSQLDKTASME